MRHHKGFIDGTCFVMICACVVFCYSHAPAKNFDGAHDTAVAGDSDQEREYPRAGYRALRDDYEFLREEKFYGRVFPVRFMKTPRELRQYVESGYSLLFVQTRRRKYPMYVIVPNNRVKGVNNIIENGAELRCVYSPVSVYYNAPVVMFVDGSVEVIIAEEKEKIARPAEQEKKPLIAAKPGKDVTPKKTEKTAQAAKQDISRYYPCGNGAQWTMVVGKDIRLIEYEILEVAGNEAQGLKREMVPNKPELDRTSEYRVVFNKNNITTIEMGVDGMGNPFEKQDVLLQEPLEPGRQWSVTIDNMERIKEIVAVGETVTAGTEENPVTYKDVVVVGETIRDDRFYSVIYNYYSGNVGFIGCKIDSSDKKESIKKHDEIKEWFMMRAN